MGKLQKDEHVYAFGSRCIKAQNLLQVTPSSHAAHRKPLIATHWRRSIHRLAVLHTISSYPSSLTSVKVGFEMTSFGHTALSSPESIIEEYQTQSSPVRFAPTSGPARSPETGHSPSSDSYGYR
ncbi:hypothetical protein AAHA92_18676 [Salvia divinorum]|uniref:Uncharacterized protein n=1 Tax=Salvia divinorum TaxID=28513 RepID=A0ABD1H6G4_SALDI